MRYGITVSMAEKRPVVDITAREFSVLKRAKLSLLTVLGIEEKFDGLLENYAEYERELLNLTLEHLVHQGKMDSSTMVGDIFRVNRRLVNLLTITRLYTDQLDHDMGTLFAAVPKAVSACVRNEYDTRFAYRFMEALRNHVQHRGMPINQISYPSSWEYRGDQPIASCYRVAPSLEVQSLLENSKIKKSVLSELSTHAKPAGFTILVREYVESFNRIHETVRTVLAQPLAEWTATFMEAFDRSHEQLGDRKHVDVIRQEEDGHLVERVAIVQDLLDRITELKRRNPPLNTLSRWYVSSQVR